MEVTDEILNHLRVLMDLIEDGTGKATFLNLDDGIHIRPIPEDSAIVYNEYKRLYVTTQVSYSNSSIGWSPDIRQAYPQLGHSNVILARAKGLIEGKETRYPFQLNLSPIFDNAKAHNIQKAFSSYLIYGRGRELPQRLNVFSNYRQNLDLETLKPLAKFEMEYEDFKELVREIQSIKLIQISPAAKC